MSQETSFILIRMGKDWIMISIFEAVRWRT